MLPSKLSSVRLEGVTPVWPWVRFGKIRVRVRVRVSVRVGSLTLTLTLTLTLN